MTTRIVLGIVIVIGIILPIVAGTQLSYVQTQITDVPDIRMSHTLAYDPHNEVVVMFGGSTNDGGYHEIGDTWIYSYEVNEWTELILSPHPFARAGHVMVYCNATNEILLYGGGGATDTWSFSCATQTWSQVITSVNPGVHYSHGMAYDSDENVVVLFGGFGGDGMTRDDTWIFNCTTREWSEVYPAEAPLNRYGLVMAYDEVVQQVILTCGNSPDGHLDDTWWYDVSTNTWDEQTTTGVRFGLKWPSMVYDSSIQKCVLFGGQVGQDPVDHTWTYDAQQNSWVRLYPDIAPPGRITGAFTFDSTFNVSILFGGGGADYGPLGDTWSFSYEANNWTDMSTVSSSATTTTGGTTPTITDGTTTPPPNTIPLEIIGIGVAIPLVAIVVVLFMKKKMQ